VRMLKRTYELKKTQKFEINGFEPRQSHKKNKSKQGIFFNFYSRANSKRKEWNKNFGVQIPKWILIDIFKAIVISTKDIEQYKKFERLLKRLDKELKECSK